MNVANLTSGKIILTVALGVLITACVSMVKAPSGINKAVQAKQAASDRGQQHLILASIHVDDYQELVRFRYVSRPEKTPPRMAKLLKRLDEQLGLQQVADWPMPALDAHYLLLKSSNGNSNLDVLLQALVQEGMIESAKAVDITAAAAQSEAQRELHAELHNKLALLAREL